MIKKTTRKMKMNKKLGEIKAFKINKKLVLSLDERWLNYFDSDQDFQVVINDNKIMLIGPRIVQSPTTNHDQSTAKEID